MIGTVTKEQITSLEDLRAQIDNIYDEIVALRRQIHMFPDLSNEEERTMQLVSKYLTELGIPHETHIAGYGISATIGNPDAHFAVGLRADMDALPIQERTQVAYASRVPGVMHACGHDIHTAALLGVARILKAMEHTLPGAVKLFFQPAEEKGGGAQQMIEAGCMENPQVRRMLAFHCDPEKPTGHITLYPTQMCASSTNLTIRINGRSGHGARPQECVDAILVAGHMLVALQSITSRSVAATNSVVLSIGKITGGSKGNIISGAVTLEGTVRTLDNETLALVKDRIQDVVTHTAEAYGANAEVDIVTQYPPVVNDRATTMLLKELAEKAFGIEEVTIQTTPRMGAEDFSYFAQAVPSSMFRLGTCGPKNDHPQMLHNEWFCPDENCLKVGILLEVLGAIQLLKEESEK